MLITFLITVLLMVLFRSHDLHTALRMYSGMIAPIRDAIRGYTLIKTNSMQQNFDITDLIRLLTMAVIIWGLPNLKNFFGSYWAALDQRSHHPEKLIPDLIPRASKLKFNLSLFYSFVMAALLFIVLSHMTQPSRFIYYQF